MAAALAALSLAVAGTAHAATTNVYTTRVIVTEQTDANLLDPWGLAASSTSPWWVANAGSGTSTIYTADGTPNALVISSPGQPMGTVYNDTGSFVVNTSPAIFIFGNRDGTIRAWVPTAGTSAVTMVNDSGFAAYTGITLAASAAGDILLAADFRNALVAGFDGSFHHITLDGGFLDPTLPSGYAPFGVQNIGGTIFIAYAVRSASGEVVPGKGSGRVAAFDTEGHFLRVVASGGPLNAPWGMALAPKSFGTLGGDLLIASSGNGQIDAYRWTGRRYVHDGALQAPGGNRLKIPGLHGIAFGNGGNAGPKGRLYFTAGPKNGAQGRLGYLKPG